MPNKNELTIDDKRNFILEKLHSYKGFDDNEESMRLKVIEFVLSSERCFEREYKPGHITGSAWVINKDRTKVLMTHHAKLNHWFQLGGHSDGDPNTMAVAMREAQEESGLQQLQFVTEEIFDIDAHKVPARDDFPAHYHYDIRFLIEASSDEPLVLTAESKELAWVELDRVHEYNNHTEIMRMVDKTRKMAS